MREVSLAAIIMLVVLITAANQTQRECFPKQIKDEPEDAHACENQLWHAVLVAISEGAENAADLAREVLKTTDIDYPRWCA